MLRTQKATGTTWKTLLILEHSFANNTRLNTPAQYKVIHVVLAVGWVFALHCDLGPAFVCQASWLAFSVDLFSVTCCRPSSIETPAHQDMLCRHMEHMRLGKQGAAAVGTGRASTSSTECRKEQLLHGQTRPQW